MLASVMPRLAERVRTKEVGKWGKKKNIFRFQNMLNTSSRALATPLKRSNRINSGKKKSAFFLYRTFIPLFFYIRKNIFSTISLYTYQLFHLFLLLSTNISFSYDSYLENEYVFHHTRKKNKVAATFPPRTPYAPIKRRMRLTLFTHSLSS